MRVLLSLHRIGPYHHARFEEAAGRLRLDVIETRPESAEYPWKFDKDGAYTVYRLSGHAHPELDPPFPLLRKQLRSVIEATNPQAIVSVGWADRSYQQLLSLAHQARIPLVLVSDSRHRDEPRSAAKEILKRQLLRGYSAALVAGVESRDYLTMLGFPSSAIFQPWDVVDNQFFENSAGELSTRNPHFLCVSRLVPKKNHVGLLHAYGIYQQQGGQWGLKLVGSGPLEQTIQRLIADLPDSGKVQMLPFCQIDDLGKVYGEASAFVLASLTDQWGLVVNEAMAAGLPCLVSTGCGCAEDLIDHRVSGWCFDPSDPLALAELMQQVELLSLEDRNDLRFRAGQQIKKFSIASFASGLESAVNHAISRPCFSRRAFLAAHLISLRP